MKGKFLVIILPLLIIVPFILAEPPRIDNVNANPSVQIPGGYVNITCYVYDPDGDLNLVKVIIIYPDYSVHNVSMNECTPPPYNYYYNATYSMIGTYHFYIWANDTAGNTTTSSVYTFEIEGDVEPPEIKNVVDYPDPQWQYGSVEISCVVTDNEGVDLVKVHITYPDSSTINATMTKSGGKYRYSAVYTEPGTYSYYIWARDINGNGNKSSTYTFTILQDTVPPSTHVHIYGEEGNNGWYKSSVEIELHATDTGSGVDKTYYKIDDSPWYIYTGPFEISEQGIHTLYYYSIDKVGNHESTHSKTIKIDYTPPQTTCHLDGTKSDDWYRTDVYVTLEATDNLAGVDKIMYKVDDGNWKEYTGEFVVTEDGEHIIRYYSIDLAGNVEEIKEKEIKIDKHTPYVEIIRPIQGFIYIMNRAIFPSITGRTVIIGAVEIEAYAINGVSGIQRVEFYINGMLMDEDYIEPYEWFWTGPAIGPTIIEVIAYDHAENTATDMIVVSAFIL